jgi:hypothetical protein
MLPSFGGGLGDKLSTAQLMPTLNANPACCSFYLDGCIHKLSSLADKTSVFFYLAGQPSGRKQICFDISKRPTPLILTFEGRLVGGSTA